MKLNLRIWIIGLLLVMGISSVLQSAPVPTAKIKLGIDVLEEEQWSILSGKRIGLITNISGVNSKLESTVDVLQKLPGVKLSALFAPEHGIRAAGNGGEVIQDTSDKKTGLPVYSIYGKHRAPTPEMLKNIDILVFDIQDIGSRTYTYVWTMTECMFAAKTADIPFIVLDRPNPINGLVVEGNTVKKGFESFIGKYPVAYCHGMTVGELAQLANTEYGIDCKLIVIPMHGWHRNMSWKDTGLFWVPTSPHIPEADTPWFYPTTGIFGELKLINEGVGYTLPFKIVGHPKFDANQFAAELNRQNLPGVYFQPYYYLPFYGSKTGQFCQGAKIVITDYTTYQPVNTGYYIMVAIQKLYPNVYDWENPKQRRFRTFDRANGTDEIRQMLINNIPADQIISSWQKDLEQFKETRKKYLIYN